MKKILICTANYYTSKYQVGSHNYARAFEKLGYKVAFLSDPISPLHYIFSKGETLNQRDEIYKNNGIHKNNIWYYVPKSYITPQNKTFLSAKYIFKNWYKFCKKSIFKLLEQNGFDEVDILWIESPLYNFMLDKVKHKKSILRIADFSKGFNNSWDLFYDKEIEIANKVDRVIYTGKNLFNQYDKIQDKNKMVYIPNGIDLDLIKFSNKDFPKEFNNIPSPRVLYIGMIDDWFDVDLLYKSAMKLQGYSFILIGDSNICLKKLESLSNIFILGSKEHKDISKYLANSDIGIIPFKINDFVDSINPVKIYEYSAYGLKVISTKFKEVENLNNYFSIVENEEKFISELVKKNSQNSQQIEKWLVKQDWKLKALEAVQF